MNFAFENTYYYSPSADPAMEGQNININKVFEKKLQEGKKMMYEADKLVRADKHDAAIKSLENAKQCYLDAITEIKNMKGGPLANSIIGSYARDIVGTYKLLRESSALKEFKTSSGQSWDGALYSVGATRCFASILSFIPPTAPIAQGMNLGANIKRRTLNNDDSNRRGETNRFTFNGFKEDCIFILNAYIKTIDNLIKVIEKQKDKKSNASITNESAIENLL